MLMDGVDGGVGVRQVGIGRVLALGVRQGGLGIGGREVRRLEVGGRSVAERGSRGVGGLVQGGQLGEAPARRRAAQPVRAVLQRGRDGLEKEVCFTSRGLKHLLKLFSHRCKTGLTISSNVRWITKVLTSGEIYYF